MQKSKRDALGDHATVSTSPVRCGDIELVSYLADAVGSVNLILDLCIAHERFGSSASPVLHGHLHYPLPADIDKQRNL